MLEEEEGVYGFCCHCFCCHERVHSEVSLARRWWGTYVFWMVSKEQYQQTLLAERSGHSDFREKLATALINEACLSGCCISVALVLGML